jgi:hypothetical protein
MLDPAGLRPAALEEMINEPLFFLSSSSTACISHRWDMMLAWWHWFQSSSDTESKKKV